MSVMCRLVCLVALIDQLLGRSTLTEANVEHRGRAIKLEDGRVKEVDPPEEVPPNEVVVRRG